MWTNTGQHRPEGAIEPAAGQESVWDYPRPPALQRDTRHIEVRCGDSVVASTTASYRVLETASPPTFYIPPGDVALDQLIETGDSSVCEWKGMATYWALQQRPNVAVAWAYPVTVDTTPHHVSFDTGEQLYAA